MGGDWQELTQSAVIGLIFAFLAAKLISVVLAFKEDNLRITRSAPASTPSTSPEDAPIPAAELPLDGSGSSDGDWEGMENTELDEGFSAASGTTMPDEAQLRLYGLYKIATEGPCTAPQPSALKLKARVKWCLKSLLIGGNCRVEDRGLKTHHGQVPVYIEEISPQNVRGVLGSVNQLSVTIGIMLAYLLSMFVPWRMLAVIGTLPCSVDIGPILHSRI